MSENKSNGLSLLFVAITVISGITLFYGWSPSGAFADDEDVRKLRSRGDIIPMAEIVEKLQQQDMRVLEAELEREHGQLVYELELLAPNGRVYEQYYNAVTGDPIGELRED